MGTHKTNKLNKDPSMIMLCVYKMYSSNNIQELSKTFQWELFYDIMIFKSTSVHQPFKHIFGIFPWWFP